MKVQLLIFVCAIVALTTAYQYGEFDDSFQHHRQRRQAKLNLNLPPTREQNVQLPANGGGSRKQGFDLNPPPNREPNFQLQASGGGSRRQGFDVNADGRFKVWESQNQRNQVHGTAGYSQHLGGPYGNSRPEFRGGVGYTRTFG